MTQLETTREPAKLTRYVFGGISGLSGLMAVFNLTAGNYAKAAVDIGLAAGFGGWAAANEQKSVQNFHKLRMVSDGFMAPAFAGLAVTSDSGFTTGIAVLASLSSVYGFYSSYKSYNELKAAGPGSAADVAEQNKPQGPQL